MQPRGAEEYGDDRDAYAQGERPFIGYVFRGTGCWSYDNHDNKCLADGIIDTLTPFLAGGNVTVYPGRKTALMQMLLEQDRELYILTFV